MAEEGRSAGVPEWFVTFGDMMSLLLTFFIMLVSFSELKSEEKYQALMDAFQEQFGYQDARAGLSPGQVRPRNSALAKMVSTARSRRLDARQADPEVQSPNGDRRLSGPAVQAKRPNVGTVLYFHGEEIDLDPGQHPELRQFADSVRSQTQMIEIRGHASSHPTKPTGLERDAWSFSFERCRRVMQFLVEQGQIEPHRMRISTTLDEPSSGPQEQTELDPRVEVSLLEETPGKAR